MYKPIISALALLLIVNAAKAQDWANLNKYHLANAKVVPAVAGQNRVVYMGDSITEGWVNADPTFFSNKPYIGRGIGGQTTGQILLRFRQDVIALKPKVVVLLAGINDIAQNNGVEFAEEPFGNIVSMVELARANQIKVVLCSVLPAAVLPWRTAIDPVAKVKALNEQLKSYANQHNIVYVDYYSALADANNGLPANLSGDGVHPNLAGYKIMEPLVEQAIAEALQRKL